MEKGELTQNLIQLSWKNEFILEKQKYFGLFSFPYLFQINDTRQELLML